MAIVSINSAVSAISGGLYKVVRMQRAGSQVNGTSPVTSTLVRIVTGKSAGTSGANITSTTMQIRYLRGTPAGLTTLVATAKRYKTLSARISCSATMEAYRTDRDIRADVADYLPRYYESFETVLSMLRKVSNESTRIHAKTNAALDEFYPETASLTGLERWERITEVESAGRTINERRTAIAEKLRNPGVTTKTSFKEMLRRFYTCSVEEIPARGAVVTKILSKRGVPGNLVDMERSVADVIPAHLTHEFEYTYLPWGEVEEFGLTWVEAQAYSWGELETTFLIPFGGE